VVQEKLRVSSGAEAIVTETMQKNYSVGVAMLWGDVPRPKRCSIVSVDFHVFERCTPLRDGVPNFGFGAGGERST
jgi:hypothetical protein